MTRPVGSAGSFVAVGANETKLGSASIAPILLESTGKHYTVALRLNGTADLRKTSRAQSRPMTALARDTKSSTLNTVPRAGPVPE